MTGDGDDRQLEGIAALADPLRRALYRFVAAAPEAVSRDQAAAALGIARPTVAFHLDRLAADGLLAVEYRRLSGRTGPGAGRPAKLYRPSGRELQVSVPPRHYEVAARLLAAAVEDARAGQPLAAAVAGRARAFGAHLAELARERAGRRQGRRARRASIHEVLEAAGYAPRQEATRTVLTNCPFDALAREHTDLVCGMNLETLDALVRDLPSGLRARLDPAPGRCCVIIEHQ